MPDLGRGQSRIQAQIGHILPNLQQRAQPHSFEVVTQGDLFVLLVGCERLLILLLFLIEPSLPMVDSC